MALALSRFAWSKGYFSIALSLWLQLSSAWNDGDEQSRNQEMRPVLNTPPPCLVALDYIPQCHNLMERGMAGTGCDEK